MLVDDLLIAEVKRRKSKCHNGTNESQTPKRDVSDKFVCKETDYESDSGVYGFLGKEKSLKLENEEIGYIGNFTEKNVERIFVDLIVLTRLQTTLS